MVILYLVLLSIPAGIILGLISAFEQFFQENKIMKNILKVIFYLLFMVVAIRLDKISDGWAIPLYIEICCLVVLIIFMGLAHHFVLQRFKKSSLKSTVSGYQRR